MLLCCLLVWSWNAHMYIHTHTSERTILTRICLATKAPDVSIRLIELLFHCLDCFIDAFTRWFSQAPHSLTHSVIPSVTFLFIHAFSVLFWKLAFSALKLVDVFLMFRGIFHTSTNTVPGCWMIPTCCKHLQTRYRQWCFKPRKAWVGTRQILLDTFRFCLFPRSGHEHNGDYHGLTFQCRIKWFLCTRAGMFASSWSTYAFHDFFFHRLSFHVAEVNSMRWNSVHWCCISRCFCLKMLGKGQTWSLHTSLWPPWLGIFEICLEVSWTLAVICCGKSEYVLKHVETILAMVIWCAYGSKILQH